MLDTTLKTYNKNKEIKTILIQNMYARDHISKTSRSLIVKIKIKTKEKEDLIFTLHG